MKKKITLLTLLFSIFAFISYSQTNCSGSATASITTGSGTVSVGSACVGDTIDLSGYASSAGNGLNLDGVNDWVNVSKKINPGVNITVSAWINTTMVSPNRGDIVTTFGGPAYAGYSLNINASWPSRIGFWVGDGVGGYVFSNTSVNDGNWHHVAGTYNDLTNEVKIYIDGNLDVTAIRNNPNLYSDSTLRIGDCGGYGCPGYEFDGNIDEVRIWNYARSLGQIQADMNKVVTPSAPGLLAYYRFDEGTGSTTSDLTGNGHDGVLSDVSMWDVPSMAPIYPDNVYWSPSAGLSDTSSLTPTAIPASFPATYYLNFEDLTTGCTGSASVTIEDHNPEITSDGPTIQCRPMNINLDAGPGVTYLWSNGATTQFVNATSSGPFYQVTVTNETGCVKTSDSIRVREVFERKLSGNYCDRYNYWLNDSIRTQKGIGEEDFDWEFVDTSNPNDTIRHTSPEYIFSLSDVNPPLQAGSTYDVRVRLKIDSAFTCFGATCQIGLLGSPGAGLNTTKLKSFHCDNRIINAPKVKAKLLTNIADTDTANAYEFNIYTDAACTNLLASVVRENSKGLLFFRHVPGIQTDTKYWCVIRGRVILQWSNYGDTCYFVTPPSFTTNTTRLQASQCNQTVNPGATYVKCDVAKQIILPLATADAYAFSVYTDSTCTTLLDSVFKNNINRKLKFSDIPTLQTSTEYWVLCYGRINGEFTPLNIGDTCSFITPAVLRTFSSNTSIEFFNISAYPNPFDNSINISFTSEFDEPASLYVYDLTGRIVYSNEELIPGNIDTFGEFLNPGMYIAEIRQRGNASKLKVVKSE